jgi:hypothetical protein
MNAKLQNNNARQVDKKHAWQDATQGGVIVYAISLYPAEE